MFVYVYRKPTQHWDDVEEASFQLFLLQTDSESSSQEQSLKKHYHQNRNKEGKAHGRAGVAGITTKP